MVNIIEDNYILSQYLDFNHMIGGSAEPEKYDFVIGNPPYMKIPKDAPEATAMQEVCYGAPNLYFIFASMGLFNLCENGEITSLTVPYDLVAAGSDYYVYLVTDEDEVVVLKKLQKFDKTLPAIGVKMKTGLTVDFRNREILREEEGAIPLFYSQHIKQGKVVFPIQKEHEYVVTEQRGLMQDNKNYLFVKRFTVKEEPRRLQCGVYLAKEFPQYKKISTQNKINFVDGVLTEMSECLVYGLYVLFNSTLYDEYYRILNGSTQVNSTEINAMSVPNLESIQEMGRKMIKSRDYSEANCNLILEGYCG